jgi:polyhydroxyalkanoate synthesis regulator protein
MQIIKKYRNRKLYCTKTSKYVTLTDIQALLKNGTELLIIENASKRDITVETCVAALTVTPEFDALKNFLNTLKV